MYFDIKPKPTTHLEYLGRAINRLISSAISDRVKYDGVGTSIPVFCGEGEHDFKHSWNDEYHFVSCRNCDFRDEL